MKVLELNKMETIQGGNACAAVTVAGAVVALADAAAVCGWLLLTPAGPAVLVGASLLIGGIGLAKCTTWG